MITLEKLAKILKKNFGPPFLSEGMVIIRLQKGRKGNRSRLYLTIGRRDIVIEEDGSVSESGTSFV